MHTKQLAECFAYIAHDDQHKIKACDHDMLDHVRKGRKAGSKENHHSLLLLYLLVNFNELIRTFLILGISMLYFVSRPIVTSVPQIQIYIQGDPRSMVG